MCSNKRHFHADVSAGTETRGSGSVDGGSERTAAAGSGARHEGQVMYYYIIVCNIRVKCLPNNRKPRGLFTEY